MTHLADEPDVKDIMGQEILTSILEGDISYSPNDESSNATNEADARVNSEVSKMEAVKWAEDVCALLSTICPITYAAERLDRLQTMLGAIKLVVVAMFSMGHRLTRLIAQRIFKGNKLVHPNELIGSVDIYSDSFMDFAIYTRKSMKSNAGNITVHDPDKTFDGCYLPQSSQAAKFETINPNHFMQACFMGGFPTDYELISKWQTQMRESPKL